MPETNGRNAFDGAAQVRVDLEPTRAHVHRRADLLGELTAPACHRVVVPAAVAGHRQRVGAECGVDEVGQQAVQAELVAHRVVPQLVVRPARVEGLVVAQLGQPRVLAAIRLLDREAVADEVHRGAAATTIVEGEVERTAVPAGQLAHVQVHAHPHLLRISRAGFAVATIDHAHGLAHVVAAEGNAALEQFGAGAAPVAGKGLAFVAVAGLRAGHGWQQQGGQQAQGHRFRRIHDRGLVEVISAATAAHSAGRWRPAPR